MRADLHLHTYYSDGTYAPSEIARRAKECGLEFISMTDHDSMEGAEEKERAAKEQGLRFVSGWEVSSYNCDGRVHVLGYHCARTAAYERFLRERSEGAEIRIEDVLKKANVCFGLALTMEDVKREQTVKTAPVHTMHAVRAYARVLNSGKNALNMKIGKIYETYFAKGRPAYSDLCRPAPEDAVDIIHETGGIAVLAHPGRIPQKGREALMDLLVGRGLDGLECTYTTHTAEETEYFKAYAKKHGLLQTGGSDFHAEGGKNVMGLPVYDPSYEVVKALLG